MTTEPAWLSGDQEQVWRRWLRVNALLPAALNRELQADAGLSLPDFDVLVHLTDTADGRIRVTDLAQSLQWEKSRLSHHLTRMERRGLVRRESCPDDARGAFIVLTAAGRAANEQAAPGHVRAVRALVFDGLSDADLRSLEAVTRSVLDRLEGRPVSEPGAPGR